MMRALEGKEPKDICNVYNKVEVPDVVGKDKILAIEELKNLGFVVLFYPDPDLLGKVSNQIPEAGRYLDYDSEVSIELKAENNSVENQAEE
ncbi:MAG: PASTA domain-containing protein [Actinobacteria bacterium]|nr:PASTA domain-containing protein [Actinomycetota bacterium]MBL7124258.1 PASTA domain-containing protein [Actinomycetota bacterium]